MFRTFLSYFVLIFIPVVSLVIAIVPYVWVKRRSARLSPKEQALFPEKEYRLANTVDSGFRPVPLSRIWGAFFVGLVGNILLFSILLNTPASLSLFIRQSELSGVLFSSIIYGIVLAMTPFIFYKLRKEKIDTKHIVYLLIVDLIILLIITGIGLFLFFISWSRLF